MFFLANATTITMLQFCSKSEGGNGPRPKQQLTRWVAFKAAIKTPLHTEEVLLRFRAPSVGFWGTLERDFWIMRRDLPGSTGASRTPP